MMAWRTFLLLGGELNKLFNLSKMKFSDLDLEKILAECEIDNFESNLGFFSRPFRINFQGTELIVKRYHPIKNGASFILENHDEYLRKLLEIGIKLPYTQMIANKKNNKTELIIFQEPFRKEELFRNIFQEASPEKLAGLCKMIFDDTLKFWRNMPKYKPIGFHPTLRNYAIHQGELYYFDSFPPMYMNQNELNKIIIKMSPFGKLIKPIVPPIALNRVSDEYYSIVKMVSGIVGSCCRLRPEYMKEILDFSISYFNKSDLKPSEIESIIQEISIPPKLSGIWRTVRRLSGNVGNPNVVLSHKK